MLNITEYFKESMDGKRFESMDDFKAYLESLTNSVVDEVYEVERSIDKFDQNELESSLGVIIDF